MHSSCRLSSGFFGVATALAGLAITVAAPAAQAQSRRDTVRCESDNGKFNRCAVPWHDAQLVKQESKGDCIRGRSWGVDRQGLWVDRGCRGLFARGGRDRPGDQGGWHPGSGWNRQIRLQCDSNKKSYQMCQVDVGRHGNVQLVKRMSDARCTQGYSWGWNRAGVWVDHGCRGQFMVDRRW
jgi:hypothetical protein